MPAIIIVVPSRKLYYYYVPLIEKQKSKDMQKMKTLFMSVYIFGNCSSLLYFNSLPALRTSGDVRGDVLPTFLVTSYDAVLVECSYVEPISSK